jgi:plasmid stability protein
MSATLTIRNLDKAVKQKLREQAAKHQRSMEAEARDILTRGVAEAGGKPGGEVGTRTIAPRKGKFDHLIGIWKDRLTTDAVMALTRGE